MVGYFSSTAETEEKDVPVKEVFESFVNTVQKEYGVTPEMIHIEQLYKI